MEKLINFIINRYNMAVQGNNPTTMFNQAFGALEMYHWLNPDQFHECEILWEEWRIKFEELEMKGR